MHAITKVPPPEMNQGQWDSPDSYFDTGQLSTDGLRLVKVNGFVRESFSVGKTLIGPQMKKLREPQPKFVGSGAGRAD